MAAAPRMQCDDLENMKTAVGAAVFQGVAAAAAAPLVNAAAVLSPSQQQPLQQHQAEGRQQQAEGQQQQQQSQTKRETDVCCSAAEQLQQHTKSQDGEQRLPDTAAAPPAAHLTSTAAAEAPAAAGPHPELKPEKPAAVLERESTAAAATAGAATAGAATAGAATAGAATAGAATAGAAAVAALVRGEGLNEVREGEDGAEKKEGFVSVAGESGAAGEDKTAAAAAETREEVKGGDDACGGCGLKEEEEEERGPSRLKFPTYEEFLKEEKEEEEQQAAAASAADDGTAAGEGSSAAAELDAAFDLFMNEVKELPSSSSSRRTGKGRAAARATKERQFAALPAFKTPEEECVRLTAQVFPSPFQVLLLGPDATEDDIRRQYRKLSLLIHPDKCKHPNAHEAFQVVNKAYEQLQQPEMREKYREVIEEAKRRVIKERVKENKRRRAQGAGVALLSEEVADLQQEITEMCERLLKETQERREYAERTRQANERYEKEQAEQLEKEELEKCKERKAFLDRRDERVEGWRQYQEALRSKEVKLQAFTGVKHQREQRKDDDLIRKRQKMQGIDSAYKSSWR